MGARKKVTGVYREQVGSEWTNGSGGTESPANSFIDITMTCN